MTAKSERDDRNPRGESESDDLRVVREAEVTQATEVANLPHSDNPVDEAAEDSFPASDPPAYSGRKDPPDDAI